MSFQYGRDSKKLQPPIEKSDHEPNPENLRLTPPPLSFPLIAWGRSWRREWRSWRREWGGPTGRLTKTRETSNK